MSKKIKKIKIQLGHTPVIRHALEKTWLRFCLLRNFTITVICSSKQVPGNVRHLGVTENKCSSTCTFLPGYVCRMHLLYVLEWTPGPKLLLSNCYISLAARIRPWGGNTLLTHSAQQMSMLQITERGVGQAQEKGGSRRVSSCTVC